MTTYRSSSALNIPDDCQVIDVSSEDFSSNRPFIFKAGVAGNVTWTPWATGADDVAIALAAGELEVCLARRIRSTGTTATSIRVYRWSGEMT